MADSKEDEHLSAREKRDLVIQAGIQAIPHVGSALATLYFGRKQELRFKRLETFYKYFATECTASGLGIRLCLYYTIPLSQF